MNDKVLVPVDIIQDFCDEIERMMCTHEETYRGGAIWEICSACGEKWADDEGGKPEFKYPQCYHDGKAMIEAAPEPVSAEPVATTLLPDPYDERGGSRFSLSDWEKLDELPAGTKLYANPPAQQWIKCSERLPNLIGSCLALSGNTIYFAFYNSDGKWAHENNFLTSVTHWMPLPAPPSEGKAMKPVTTRPKTCPECKQKFLRTRAIQPVCERYECMTAHALKVAEKNKANRLRSESRKRKEAKKQWQEKNATLGELAQKAQKEFNAWIRVRDHGHACISCGRSTGCKVNAGHYRSVGAQPALRFNSHNVHLQCEHCNCHKSGNAIEYRIRLVDKIGLDRVEWLEKDHGTNKYSKDDLRRIARIFRKRERLYKRLKGL